MRQSRVTLTSKKVPGLLEYRVVFVVLRVLYPQRTGHDRNDTGMRWSIKVGIEATREGIIGKRVIRLYSLFECSTTTTWTRISRKGLFAL